MKIVTAAEMREIDRITSQRFGVSLLTLMKNAGTAVANFVLNEYPEAKSIGVVCGKGNNGGDGFVTANVLAGEARDVRVLLLADPAELRGDAAAMFAKLSCMSVVARSEEDLADKVASEVFESDLLVDAILGSGFKPPVSGLYAAAISALNASGSKIVAVDVPSGADSDQYGDQKGPIVSADAVVTFTAPRPAHVFGKISNGPIVIAQIGSPQEAISSSLNLDLTTPHDIAPLICPRPADSNKGSFGHVLVIGGSRGKAGSVAMAGMAALRSGAGLSTVATAKSAQATVAGFHAELMTEGLSETEEGTISESALASLQKLSEKKTVLAVGPGISGNDETRSLVRNLVKQRTVPVVLDADGLNAFDRVPNELNGDGPPLVITPHPGEMSRLIGASIAEVQKDRIGIARRFASDHNLIVVLKGHRTLVADPSGAVWVNTTGNPGMATGGTGDILTGMTAGLIAQNPHKILHAVITAVYLHGLAGDVACEEMGEHSLVATDLLLGLPEAFERSREDGQRLTIEYR